MDYKLLQGDSRNVLKALPDNSIDCCVTSPPYFSLRTYDNDAQIGLENTVFDYIDQLSKVFEEIRRVLKPEGTFWLNIGDTYASYRDQSCRIQTVTGKSRNEPTGGQASNRNAKYLKESGLKHKDLIGVPWRLAFKLQSMGWYLRSDIIWCLSGGVWVYVKTPNGMSVMTIKDLYRLMSTKQKDNITYLWNGLSWTKVLGVSKTARKGNEIEIVLRSGERISCTPNHKFQTRNGLKEAKDFELGDCLVSTTLPEPEIPRDCIIDEDAAWFAGLYLAEGSRYGGQITISGHIKEKERLIRMEKISKKFGGTISKLVIGNKMNIFIRGKILNAILDELITGKVAKNKGISNFLWDFSNKILESFLDGYLSGDGHWDEKNNRWRLNFCRNYNLERDLRVLCARLGFFLTLHPKFAKFDGKRFPSFNGELKKTIGNHLNNKDKNEIVEIRKSRCRYVYDIGVEDEPHLFSLSSGILTHNSKGSCLPESVKDRPSKCHEYIFLLSKNEKYYYDHETIKDPTVDGKEKRNKRTVWNVNPKPFKLGKHFATYPEELIIPCVLAGCPKGGTVIDPFNGAGTTGVVAMKNGRNYIGVELNPEYIEITEKRFKMLGLVEDKNDVFE